MDTPTLAQQMAALLEMVTTLFSSILTMVGQLVSTITANPYLMVGFAIVIISFVIGVLVRIVRNLGHRRA